MTTENNNLDSAQKAVDQPRLVRLLPCPFCGSEAEITDESQPDRPASWFFAWCKNRAECSCWLAAASPDLAAAKWNRRNENGIKGWTPITGRMPKTGTKVIVCGTYTRTGYQWRTMARWQPAGTIDATYWDEYPDGWESDDGDTITNPTDIWLEDPVEVEQAGFLENVTHWMPLPSLPNA